MASGCERTDALIRTLPLDTMHRLAAGPYSMSQAAAVAKALLAYYQDEPQSCFILRTPPGSFPVTILYPLEQPDERGRALQGMIPLLESQPRPATARYLFGADLQTVRWALRSEPVDDLLVGWLYVAALSDLQGIEVPVMDLAMQGASPQVRAAAVAALTIALPDARVLANATKLRDIGERSTLHRDATLRETGARLLARVYSVQSGTPGGSTPAPTTPRAAAADLWPWITGAAVVLTIGAFVIVRRRARN